MSEEEAELEQQTASPAEEEQQSLHKVSSDQESNNTQSPREEEQDENLELLRNASAHDFLGGGNPLDRYETEIEDLRELSGINQELYPLRWIRWETSYIFPSGFRTPEWREQAGDIAYVLCMTHDKGRVIISIVKDGHCNVIKGYVITETGFEDLDYHSVSRGHANLAAALSSVSEVFASMYAKIANTKIQESQSLLKSVALNNDLITLPQPVLFLPDQEAEKDNIEIQEFVEPEDDDPIVPFPKQPNSDNDFWQLVTKLKHFAAPSTDYTRTEIIEASESPLIREISGFRAVIQSSSIPPMIDVLSARIDQSDTKRQAQQDAVLKILAAISVSPIIRRNLAKEEYVKPLFELIQKGEVNKPLTPSVENLFTTIANCAKNRKFREYVCNKDNLQPLITRLPNNSIAPKVCFVLWTLNRSSNSTNLLLEGHLNIELDKIVNTSNQSDNTELMLNVIRLLHSVALYGGSTVQKLTNHQIAYFCRGLDSSNEDLVAMAARAFTIYQIPDDSQKMFCGANCRGPEKLVRTLSSQNIQVLLAGLEVIACVGRISKIREELFHSEWNIIPSLKNLWKHENPDVIKAVLKVIGVLAVYPKCAKWTVSEVLIPGLLKYLKKTDFDFVVYSATAIGTCCIENENLKRLMELNGIRTLWSLMKNNNPKVQASATKALVPFLQSKESPAIIRSFVDGLDLLTDLLRSDEPEVQASACMAISEVAKDKENLAVMTDLGLVELLSRLLTTQNDQVRKSLADAIGYAADWSNNRRRFGEEGVVTPLVMFLRPPSNNKEVHAATAKALRVLSEDTENSRRLSQSGVVDYLLTMVESEDQELQMAGAIAIRNIRTNQN